MKFDTDDKKIIEKFLTEEKISEFYRLGYLLDSDVEDPIFKLDLIFSDYYSNNREYEKSIEFLEKFKKNYDEYLDYIPEYYYDEKAYNQLLNQNYQESIKNFTKYKKEIADPHPLHP